MATEHALRLHVHGDEERKIGWLELFYDLVYVTIVIQLGDFLSDRVSPAGALMFVLLFIPVWWSWTGMMFYFNRFLVDDVLHRLLVGAQMLAVAFMAISVTAAFGAGDRVFAAAYFAVRMVLVILYLRAWRHVVDARPLIRRYAAGFAIASSFWLVSVAVPAPARYGLWVVGLALEFWTPLSARSRRLQSTLPPDVPHLTERYGLFTIIVLGESFIKVVGTLAGHPPTLASWTFTALGFAIAVAVWWLYFDTAQGREPDPRRRSAYLWIYVHLPITIGITATGVAITKFVLLGFGSALPDRYRWLLAGAVALFLVSAAVLALVVDAAGRAATMRRRASARTAAAAAVLAVGLLGGPLPAIGVVLLIALACGAAVLADTALARPGAAAAPPLAETGGP